jgi:SAM-dependent methyltransferase
MNIRKLVKSILPDPIRPSAPEEPVSTPVVDTPAKSAHELGFWETRLAEIGIEPGTEYYRKFMMKMGNIEDISFFDGLVCLDIGCGPRGSLTWLRNARAAIGVDPLAEQYRQFGIERHSMIYLSCGAERIPLPSQYVDVIFSMNSLDHVDNLDRVCAEIRRLLKPGGYFIGSLNLHEPATVCEPWTLTEELLDRELFAGWEREYYEIRPRLDYPEQFGPYKYFFEPCPPELLSAPGPKALWCRFHAPR